MNRDEIIRMARDAGITFVTEHGVASATPEWLERFAALVAAAERERIIAANAPEIEKVNAHIKMLETAVLAEREACAKVCESKMPNPVKNWADAQIVNALRDCAASIRERSNT